jgi:hypothetical protein
VSPEENEYLVKTTVVNDDGIETIELISIGPSDLAGLYVSIDEGMYSTPVDPEEDIDGDGWSTSSAGARDRPSTPQKTRRCSAPATGTRATTSSPRERGGVDLPQSKTELGRDRA